MNCHGDWFGGWARWGRRGGWPRPFGVLMRRDRDAGRPPAPVPRPGRLGKLMFVLASLWPVRVHPITDSNTPEAGDGPLPAARGTGWVSATFPRACASVSSRSCHLVVLAA